MTEEQKEKYANFLDKISEILGLNKPVDILRLCAVTDEYLRPIEKHIAELEKKNAELEAQIEKMQETLKSDLIARLKEDISYSTSPSCTKGMELFIKSIERWEIKKKMKTFDDMLEYELGEEVQLFNAPRQHPRNCFETGTKGKIIEFLENGLLIETDEGEQIRTYLPVVVCKCKRR